MTEVQQLATLLSYQKGKPPRKEVRSERSLPLLTPEYLRGNAEPELVPVTPDAVLLKGDELVLLWDGSNAGEFFRAKPGVLASTMVVFSFDESQITRDYLFYEFKRFEAHLKGQTSGSGIPHVDKEILLNHTIRLISKEQQFKITEILSAIDRALEQTRALIAKYQRMKTGLMQDLLTRGIDEQGRLRHPDTHEFKDSRLGRIPVEWEVAPLVDVTLKISDRDHTTPQYVEHGVKIVSPQNFLGDDEIDFDSCPEITAEAHEINRRKTDVQSGDLLFHRIGAGLGQVRFVHENMPDFSILHSLCLIRPNLKLLDSKYLYWFTKSGAFQRQIGTEIQSIGVPDLGLQKIEELLTVYPSSVNEQSQIVGLLEAIQSKIRVANTALQKLESLKDGLMQDLLSGNKSVESLLQQYAALASTSATLEPQPT